MRALHIAVLSAALAVSAGTSAQEPAPDPNPGPSPEPAPAFSVFDMPALVAGNRRAIEALRRNDIQRAQAEVRSLTDRFPEIAEIHVTRALAEGAAGETDAALASLTRAVELGFRGTARILRRGELAALRDTPEIARLIALETELPPPEPALTPATPAPVAGGIAVIGERSVSWDGAEGLRAEIGPMGAEARPLTGPEVPPALAERLGAWAAAGRAAGNAGDLYDNRDRDHSPLPQGLLPQLTRTAYDETAKSRGLDYGLAGLIRFGVPVIGNSSTANTGGPFWRSLPRQLMTNPAAMARADALYRANHLYVYPEHKDHDPETGDLFPANIPQVLVSRGSSYSDMPFVTAAALAMAAFPPETKARLVEEGLVAPTLQMVLRRAMAPAARVYLSRQAHPVAFDPRAVDPLAVIAIAQRIEAGGIPPMVALSVEAETEAVPGRDYMAPNLGQRLFDTGPAIGRVMRTTAAEMVLEVSAEATRDPNGRPLIFHWRVLSGDPERVRIEPIGPSRTKARIRVGWHEPFPVPGRQDLTSARVEIGVFADNGAYLSAPSFVSVAFPRGQARVYEGGRILSVDYGARPEVYDDPLIWPARDWRDDYRYAPDGSPLGWTRTGPGSATADFAADGALVLARDERGRPVLAETVTYRTEPREDGTTRTVWEPTGLAHAYVYAGPEDYVGLRARAPE